ncbi:DUF1499 domain-containing protein [Gymnodinialimonas ceratoperidinii]|uniref:DUF1499 domain-containing protein n=1 Tax=Gymnodinialimonas ceratoperidinii TaxID=2856823 RepID=A0A8F6TTQ0_9RHOB|nr:DUF1499 domain-containing protein [Gymnodinialimonas ceratoperidinii]QXT38771.1 DUF1499 domain-containing protein [Gymnodinialimonas ceratoperidinii]
MRILIYILAALVVVTLAAALYVRLAPVDTARWHVDPETVTPPTTPNYVLLAGDRAVAIDAPSLSVAGRLQAAAEAEGATLVAGSLGEGFATYMVRSRLMGYPDFISIRLVPEEETTRLHLFSRSAYGRSDFGVNTARAQRWLTAARGEGSTV